MKVSKNAYLEVFGVAVIVLALFRCAYPRVAMTQSERDALDSLDVKSDTLRVDTISTSDIVGKVDLSLSPTPSASTKERTLTSESYKPGFKVHPIYSIPGRFKDCFPDSQHVHLAAAEQWGVKAVQNRADAERRKSELVYIAANPYYCIDDLRSSVPYLVPRAATLLNDIGRAYFDSLFVKGIPLHKMVITSVLRTKDDVSLLQRRNGNATENSCHLYGTTVDISQNRYVTVSDPRKAPMRSVQNDTLKWVLSEVLRDFREQGRCYIKYEVKQGCFHVTVR